MHIIYTCLSNTYYNIKTILNEDTSNIYKCMIRDFNTCCKVDFFIKHCLSLFLTDLHRFILQSTNSDSQNIDTFITSDLNYYNYDNFDRDLKNSKYYIFMIVDNKLYSDNLNIIKKPTDYVELNEYFYEYLIKNKDYIKSFIINNKIPFHIVFYDNINKTISSSKYRILNIGNNLEIVKTSILDTINNININEIDNYNIVEYFIK